MATDATGTPTAKGIPKFNTANDAPSGKGTNAMMDAIDALLGWVKVRKNSGGSDFERGRLNLIEGTGIALTVADDAGNNEVDVTITATSSAALVTSLPGSPNDGDEITLVDSTTAPTYQWRLRYVSAKATNKWIFVGGAPAYSIVATFQNVASSTYTDLGTVGPDFTIPVAGEYWVKVGSQTYNVHATAERAGYMSFAIGAAAAVDANAWMSGRMSPAQTGADLGGEKDTLITAAASDLIRAKYRNPNGGTDVFFGARTLFVRPKAIGG